MQCHTLLCEMLIRRCAQVEMNNWEKGTQSHMKLDSQTNSANIIPGHYINYQKMSENLAIVRQRLNRPLTFAEKILYSHLDDPHGQVSYLDRSH